jgi:hypothetical protein
MFQKKFVEKTIKHILYPIIFSRKPGCLWDNVEKYGRVIYATVLRRIGGSWMLDNEDKNTDTHSEYAKFNAFPW